MSTAGGAVDPPVLTPPEANRVLSDQWRALRRPATFVAVLAAPAAVRVERVRVVVWPRIFRLPRFRRFDGYSA